MLHSVFGSNPTGIFNNEFRCHWTTTHRCACPLSTVVDETVAVDGQKPDYGIRRTGNPGNVG
jgi:hypothetical protein